MIRILEGMALLAGVSLYLAPSIMADAREGDDALAITLVNVFLGWTVIGWIAALMLARRPVNEQRLSQVAVRIRQAVARATIEKIVAHAKSGAALAGGIAHTSPRAQPAPIPVAIHRDRIRQQ